jgi:ubiquinone/menaquinone biosynthesis C-methylase UbiE
MYKKVAENPQGDFHFDLGRKLAENLGYPSHDLDKIPPDSIESFAGVGYHLDLADVKEGESVLDLGSGSGMDSFLAALKVGTAGKVVGMDMTEEQLMKARRLGVNFHNVSFQKGYIEKLPFENKSFDVVISNGVINLCAEKENVFKEIARILKQGGRLAISDIVTEKELPEDIVCNATLLASCIGGAMQIDRLKRTIEERNMKVIKLRENQQYQFLSKSALSATKTFGVKSISILARKS